MLVAVAGLRAEASGPDTCHPVVVDLPSLAKPQRLVQGGDLLLGGVPSQCTHNLVHFRGRMWCSNCAASFAVTSWVPQSFRSSCLGHVAEDTARRNFTKLEAGLLLTGWAAQRDQLRPCRFLLGSFSRAARGKATVLHMRASHALLPNIGCDGGGGYP